VINTGESRENFVHFHKYIYVLLYLLKTCQHFCLSMPSGRKLFFRNWAFKKTQTGECLLLKDETVGYYFLEWVFQKTDSCCCLLSLNAHCMNHRIESRSGLPQKNRENE